MTRFAGLLTLALLASGPVSLVAQDISGDWEIAVDAGQGGTPIDATIKQEGEAVTGSVNSPLGRVGFAGTFVNGVLTVTYALPLPGQTLEAVMTGKLDGELMNGQLVLGGLGQIPWTARRKPPSEAAAASTPPEPEPAADGPVPVDANGTWDIVFKLSPQGEMPMSLTLTQTDDKVTGTARAPTGDAAVTGSMIGRALTISFNVRTPLGQMPVAMTGDLGAQGFSGKATIAGMGEADWIGRPAKP